MNKIFKVIWSKSKECYVVVSEIASNYSAKKNCIGQCFCRIGGNRRRGACYGGALADGAYR